MHFGIWLFPHDFFPRWENGWTIGMNVSSPCGAESEANTTLQKGSKLLVSRMMEVVWVSAGIALIYKDMHTFCRVRKKVSLYSLSKVLFCQPQPESDGSTKSLQGEPKFKEPLLTWGGWKLSSEEGWGVPGWRPHTGEMAWGLGLETSSQDLGLTPWHMWKHSSIESLSSSPHWHCTKDIKSTTCNSASSSQTLNALRSFLLSPAEGVAELIEEITEIPAVSQRLSLTT